MEITNLHKRPHPEKAPIPVPFEAQKIHEEIVERLRSLCARTTILCTSETFRKSWEQIGECVDRYQQTIIDASEYRTTCSEGCSSCCRHWVEDVNSFEAEIIAEYLRTRWPERIPAIINRCREDVGSLEKLSSMVDRKLRTLRKAKAKKIDAMDLLLSAFYQMRRPCPLLDCDSCLIYAVRPLTCRMYVSFGDPLLCNPDLVDDGEMPTYLFGFEDEARKTIDDLHVRYEKVEGDTGLRSLLLKYLSA